jgi:ATP-dependent RNA helicase MSS116
MGFREDIDAIVEFLPRTPERQTFLFSATVSRSIQQVARAILDRNHRYIAIDTEGSSPVHAHVPQYHTVLPSAKDQIPHLFRLIAHDQLTSPGSSKVIVFLPTTKMTQLFATIMRQLADKILPAGRATRVFEIHSKRAQASRSNTSDAFRNDKSGASILITSDVSARGVDYPRVSRVIQVGIPAGTDQYVHRIGRTGRAGTTGRGDLVLLPWEIGFVTWQLSEMPLKPLTLNELRAQTEDLAAQHDGDPQSFFEAAQKTSIPDGKRVNTIRTPRFQQSVVKGLDEIDTHIQELLGTLDEEAVQETMASLLGYYIAKSPELRMHDKGAIVQGCKDWTVEALGLPVPPFVSEAFLQRLGVDDGRTKKFGRRWQAPSFQKSGPSWAGRGQTRLKGREKPVPDWAQPLDEDDKDPGDAMEYRSRRYKSGMSGKRDSWGGGSGRSRSGGGGGYGKSREAGGFGGGGYGKSREEGGFGGGGYGKRREEGGFGGGGYGKRREEGGFGGGGYGKRREEGGFGGGEGRYGQRREESGFGLQK